jgi:hypothetical protein
MASVRLAIDNDELVLGGRFAVVKLSYSFYWPSYRSCEGLRPEDWQRIAKPNGWHEDKREAGERQMQLSHAHLRM